jgi:phosphoglycolate phosphatase
VLFDLDGTLLDTLEDIARSANEVLAELGFSEHPAESYRQFIGEGVATLFERALPAGAEGDDPGLVARCVEGFRVTYGRGWNISTRPYPGIAELLDGLASRSLGLAVLSNKPDEFTRQCVDEYLARWSFQAVFGGREDVPRKPDPAGALQIADRLGVPPAAIVYLGDSSVDMAAARRAGMIPIGAAWGFRSVDELRSSGAAEVIAHPLDLLDLLDRRRTSS